MNAETPNPAFEPTAASGVGSISRWATSGVTSKDTKTRNTRPQSETHELIARTNREMPQLLRRSLRI